MTDLTLNYGAGETWIVTVTDDGDPLDLTGWTADLLSLPTALTDLVTVAVSDAGAGELSLRIEPGADRRGHEFWIRLTPDDDDLDVWTTPVRLVIG